jgi:hypothetical protein
VVTISHLACYLKKKNLRACLLCWSHWLKQLVPKRVSLPLFDPSPTSFIHSLLPLVTLFSRYFRSIAIRVESYPGLDIESNCRLGSFTFDNPSRTSHLVTASSLEIRRPNQTKPNRAC